MARYDQQLASEAETQAVAAVARSVAAPGRHGLMAQIRLSRARFAMGEPDQGCEDGDQALALAGDSMSTMVTTRLRELVVDTEPYREQPQVREFRGRVREMLHG